MSKSDPITKKEILVAVGTILFGVLAVTATVTIGPRLSLDVLPGSRSGSSLRALPPP